MTRPGIEPRSPGPLVNTLSFLKDRLWQSLGVMSNYIQFTEFMLKSTHITRKK